MTDDFDAAVLTGKDDRTTVPRRLRDKQTPEWTELAQLAERGHPRASSATCCCSRHRTPPSSTAPTRCSSGCTARPTAGRRPTCPGWSASAPPGCGSTCARGSTRGTSCGSTLTTGRSPMVVELSAWYAEDDGAGAGGGCGRVGRPCARAAPARRATSPRRRPAAGRADRGVVHGCFWHGCGSTSTRRRRTRSGGGSSWQSVQRRDADTLLQLGGGRVAAGRGVGARGHGGRLPNRLRDLCRERGGLGAGGGGARS